MSDAQWSDDRVTTLSKLWLDGLSASQIAKQLGGVTRNAVIGKVHRLGLSAGDAFAPRSGGGGSHPQDLTPRAAPCPAPHAAPADRRSDACTGP